MSERLTYVRRIPRILSRDHLLAEFESVFRAMEKDHDVDWDTVDIELEQDEDSVDYSTLFEQRTEHFYFHRLRVTGRGEPLEGSDEVGAEA